MGGDIKVQAYFNYWEMKPSQIQAKLYDLTVRGINTLSCFVPWTHFESDIHHSLQKFLKASFDARLKIRLFVMPSLGINYPNCGIPKELISNHANLAVDKQGALIMNRSAPNIFPLPSFSSPEVLKAFGNYLIRVASVVSDVCNEAQSNTSCPAGNFNNSWIEILITGSFLDNYRNPTLLEGDHGDFSAAQVIAFRDFHPIQGHESFNHHRFTTHVEKQLRLKTEMIFAKKNGQCRVVQSALLNPEADPANVNAVLASQVIEFKPPITAFYKTIKRREAMEVLLTPGALKNISQDEKTFLIASSLIYSGQVLLPLDIVMNQSFELTSKINEIKTAFEHLQDGAVVADGQIAYLTASAHSAEPRTRSGLEKLSGTSVKLVTSTEKIRALSEKLIFVDPKTPVQNAGLIQLMSAAQTGKVVAIPAYSETIINYADDAKEQFMKLRRLKTPLKINFGLQYEVFEIGSGFAVFYNPSCFYIDDNLTLHDMQRQRLSDENLPLFVKAMLGLAEVTRGFACDNEKVDVVNYKGVYFLMNPTSQAQTVRLNFTQKQWLEFAGERMQKDVFETAIGPFGILVVRDHDSKAVAMNTAAMSTSMLSKPGEWHA